MTLQSFNRFFNNDLNLDVMIQRIREMIVRLPDNMGRIIKFACLIGLRPTEVVESVKLINNQESFAKYYNPDMMALEHFRFPEIFLRQTKKAYISLVNAEILDTVRGDTRQTPSHNAIRLACRRRRISMEMHLCRKIFASHLRQSGIQAEVVNLLQGRVDSDILTRHYLVPSSTLKDQVLDALKQLQKMIDN